MPAFGRLGKHSNRSQQALVEQLAAGGAPSSVSSAATNGPASAAESPAANTSTTPLSALSSSQNTAFSSSESFNSRAQQGQHHHQLPPPPSNSSSHQQQQQQHHQPSSPSAPPPPQLYSSPSAASSINSPLPPSLQNPGAHVAGSPVFDSRQKHPDFVDAAAVSRSQSHRYSTIHTQPPPSQLYELGSSSVDDLSSGNYGPHPSIQNQHQQIPLPSQQQTPVPEKRSTRKLIKGIFSGSSKVGSSDSSHHHHHHSFGHSSHSHNQPYDNTGGLARRPSKRVSKNPPPSLTTSFSQVSQTSPDRPTQDWQQQQQHPQQQYHPQSPLQGVGEVEEYYSKRDSNVPPSSQGSRLSLHNTIRQVTGELETSPYEEVVFRPHQQAPPLQQQQQQQQPHVQLPHPQDQQAQQTPSLTRYDSGAYDNPLPQNSLHSAQHQQQFALGNPQQLQYQQGGGDSRILPGHLGVSTQQPNPETVSQFSHESQITDSDQRSTNLHSAQNSPAVNHALYVQNQGSTTSLPPVQHSTPQQPQQQSGMAPPPAGGPPPARRNQEAEKGLRSQVDIPAGPPPGYRHSTSSMNNMNPLPPPPSQQSGSQNTGYRGDRNPQFDAQSGEQGRNSPQPAANDAAGEDKQFKDLLVKYKNVKRLYFDGKSQIEQLSGQVEQLQNAVANQRMSQSRTALDDNEYTTRFNRLNGAINNLSFNIRKDWRCVPSWLEKFVSPDALKTGKQEMTAIGRAVISRWLVDEIFNKCFHPGLDQQLSQQLKDIELSIRHNSYTLNSQEEFDALTTKVVNWRMATLEGLHRKLNSPATTENTNMYTKKATTNLTACLYQHLNNPPPPGVEGSTSMIVELAVGIAANMPLESRDVAITYPLPGDILQPNLMDVEKTPLPALEGQRPEGEGGSEDKGDKDKTGKSGADKAKTGMLTRAPGGGSSADRKGSNASMLGTINTDADTGVAMPSEPSRIRFAGFVALEVRGRQVLMKAPIWTM